MTTRLASAAVDDLSARYEFGHFLHEVRYEGPPGAAGGALEVIASIFGAHVSALRKLARVSERISSGEFAGLIQLRTRKGMPLTWSHVEVLSEVRSTKRRRELAHEATAEGWSVGKLTKVVRHGAAQARAATRASRQAAPPLAFTETEGCAPAAQDK